MLSITQPARALIDPAEGVASAVEARRWVVPLLVLMLAVSFSGVAFATRWDASSAVVRELSSGGELQKTTERELADKVQTRSRVKLVGGVAKGVFLMPLVALLFAVGLKVSGWIINRSILFSRSFSTVTIAMLPIAVYHLVFGSVALASAQLGDNHAERLVPTHLGHLLTGLSPELGRLASVVDVFNIWVAVLMGLGFAAATKWSRAKGVLFGLVLYLAWSGVFLVGLPAMGGGGR